MLCLAGKFEKKHNTKVLNTLEGWKYIFGEAISKGKEHTVNCICLTECIERIKKLLTPGLNIFVASLRFNFLLCCVRLKIGLI